MTELVNSRCQECSPKDWQCSSCAKLDVTVRKNIRDMKKRAAPPPVVLFYATTAAVPLLGGHESALLAGHDYPPMPAPAALSINGQVMYPPPVPPVVPAVPNLANGVPPVVTAVTNLANGVPPVVPAGSLKRAHHEYDLESSSDGSHHRALHHRYSAKKQTTPIAPKTPIQVLDSSSDSDGSCSSSSSQTGDEDEDAAKKLAAKKEKVKMPRITKEERACVCEWIQKDRKDGKMLNARWIRNGGAKGQTMTATSAEVKTSGAFESLATLWLCLCWFFITSFLCRYVNRKLRAKAKPFLWTKDVAKKRWIALLVACFVVLFIVLFQVTYVPQV
jgi:hypothetical protein